MATSRPHPVNQTARLCTSLTTAGFTVTPGRCWCCLDCCCDSRQFNWCSNQTTEIQHHIDFKHRIISPTPPNPPQKKKKRIKQQNYKPQIGQPINNWKSIKKENIDQSRSNLQIRSKSQRKRATCIYAIKQSYHSIFNPRRTKNKTRGIKWSHPAKAKKYKILEEIEIKRGKKIFRFDTFVDSLAFGAVALLQRTLSPDDATLTTTCVITTAKLVRRYEWHRRTQIKGWRNQLLGWPIILPNRPTGRKTCHGKTANTITHRAQTPTATAIIRYDYNRVYMQAIKDSLDNEKPSILPCKILEIIIKGEHALPIDNHNPRPPISNIYLQRQSSDLVNVPHQTSNQQVEKKHPGY